LTKQLIANVKPIIPKANPKIEDVNSIAFFFFVVHQKKNAVFLRAVFMNEHKNGKENLKTSPSHKFLTQIMY